MSIFYRQVNDFKLSRGEGTFKFYGLINSESYSPEITFLTNIYYNDSSRIKEAICKEPKKENISQYLKQIVYNCKIKEIYKTITNLRILDSDYVSGIPYDYNDTLREIKAGTLDNNTVSESLPLFNIHNIYCDNKKDILIFIGTIFDEIKESKTFPILFPSLDKCQSECYVPASTSGKEIQIKCTLCKAITQKSNFVFEHQILKNGKDEILFFNEFKIDKYIKGKPVGKFRKINKPCGKVKEKLELYKTEIEGAESEDD
jgi:hypothetical protein